MKKLLKEIFRIVAPAVVVLLVLAGIVLAQTPNGIRGAFSGDVVVRSPFRLLVSGHISSGGSTFADVSGTCTLGTNCAITFSKAYVNAPACIAQDTTAAAATKAVASTTGVTFTGTGTDVLVYQCEGIHE